MSKRSKIVFTILGFLLLISVAFKINEMRTPLAQRLIAIDNDTRNMALARLPGMNESKKKQLVQQLLPFMSAANNPEPASRRYAAYAIRKLDGRGDEVLKAHAAAIQDKEAAIRDEAMVAFLNIGADGAPILAQTFKTTSPEAARSVETALVKMELSAVPSLVRLLNESTPAPLRAATALKKIGAPAKDAVPALEPLLKSDDDDVRAQAALALNSIAPYRPDTARILGELVGKRPWDDLSREIIAMLDKMADQARDAREPLSKRMLAEKENFEDPNAARVVLARTLEKVDPRRREALDLNFDLRQVNVALRYRAAVVISEMNPPNIGMMETLMSALEDKDMTVAARAVVGLARMGFDKTERIKKTAVPRIRLAIARLKKAQIPGFEASVEKALPTLPK